MYLLDTDHVRLDQRGDPLVTARITAAGPTLVATCIVTVEEQLRGWLAVIHGARTGQQRSTAYARLRATVEYFASIRLLDYDEVADRHFMALRQAGLRIGSRDLRIAAIALRHNAVVVTRNSRDFGQVPGLLLADWSVP